MQPSNPLGFSVYPSTWSQFKQQLASLFVEGSTVFTSLHIVEEMNESYVKNVEEMIEAVGKTGQISAQKCRESVEKRFSMERMVDEYESVFFKKIGK